MSGTKLDIFWHCDFLYRVTKIENELSLFNGLYIWLDDQMK